MNIQQATEKWVNSWNCIHQNLMQDALEGREDKWQCLNPDEDGEDEWMPMWGWLWTFSDSADYYWLENLGGIKKMTECGITVYEHEDYGYWFGINGAGYGFYEEHWIPLYKARGLQWHDSE